MSIPPNDLKLTVASAAASWASRMASSSSWRRSRSGLMLRRLDRMRSALCSLASSAFLAAMIAVLLHAKASRTCSLVAEADLAASAFFEEAARWARSLMM